MNSSPPRSPPVSLAVRRAVSGVGGEPNRGARVASLAARSAAWQRGRAMHRVVTALPRGPRGATCLALGVTAVAVRGTPGVLLGILTAMLVLDAVVPIPGVSRTEADERFRRLVRSRRRARRLRRFRGLEPEALELVDDRTGWMATAERRHLGVQVIALESVSATLEERQRRTFDRAFRPDASAAAHWTRLWLAQAHGAALPPVSVYRVGDAHVVRDGHHRISVARDLGLSAIEADVVELRRGAR